MNPTRVEAVLAQAVECGVVAGAVATVGDLQGTRLEAAQGLRTLGQPAPMAMDTVFYIASMTKAVTTVAAMQLVEQGRLALDAPAAAVLPQLGETQVLEGFDAAGRPQLRPPRTAITLRNLLTHTSGYSYDLVHPDLVRYSQATGMPSVLTCKQAALAVPLLFDPGARWEYGIGIDWVGRLVEAVTGAKLGDVLQKQIFAPLGMNSTAFRISADMRARLAGMHARLPDGKLAAIPFEIEQAPEFEMGGGGLYGTVPDYLRFVRMILGDGALDGVHVLAADTVAEMRRNQLGDMRGVGICGAVGSAVFEAADMFPGQDAAWGLGFLLNPVAVAGGRSAGSLSWAGLANTYYWIDPAAGLAAILAMQVLPFFDPPVVQLVRDFEQAVYSR